MTAFDLHGFRRVVTGSDEHGRSTTVIDGPPSAFMYEDCYAQLWATDTTPADNSGSSDAAASPLRLDVPPGGSRFWLGRLTPGHGTDRQHDVPIAEVLRTFGAHVDADDPSVHYTTTTDYIVVLAGEVVLVLDDSEVVLRPFDSIVQRGTRHRWENRTADDALIAFVMIDAAKAE